MKPHAEIEMSDSARTLLDAMTAFSKPTPKGGRSLCADTVGLRQISGIPHRLIYLVLGELRGRGLVSYSSRGYYQILG